MVGSGLTQGSGANGCKFTSGGPPSTSLSATGSKLLVAFAEIYALPPVIAWLNKDALIERFDAESDDQAALSHEARQKAEDEVMADRLSIAR